MRLFLLFLCFHLSVASRSLLPDVLLMKNGEMTTGRRLPPQPQLVCVSGCSHTVDEVLCTNIGTTDEAIWKCETPSLPDSVRFRHSEVSCEGYDNADDPFILAGSCQFRYGLVGGTEWGNGPIIIGGLVLLVLLANNCNRDKRVPLATPVATPVAQSGPGFLSGLGIGALAGNAYGRRSRGPRRSYWGRSSRSSRSSSGRSYRPTRTYARSKNR